MVKRKLQDKTKRYEIARRSEINADALLPVIQNLTAEGYNLSDVGMLLGYCGDSPANWLYNLRKKHPEITDAIQIGRQAANTELIRTAFQESVGYWIEEEEIFANNVPVIPVSDKPFGPAKPMQDRYINKSRKTKRRFIQPNTQLLFKLMCCRMPEFFSDTKKVEINKKSLELKGTIEQEIKQFAGALYKIVSGEDILDSKKQIDNEEIIEAKFEPIAES